MNTTLLDLTADEVLATTRAVRKRLDLTRPVPRGVVEECMALAMQAPNGSNMNSWRFVAVDDRETIERMAAIYGAAMDDHIRSLGDAVGDDYAGASIPGAGEIGSSVQYLREHMHEVPLLMIPLFAGRPEGASVFMQASMWGSVVQAAWSFMLALRPRGLGSCWTTVHLCREREMGELLGIPSRYTQVGLLPVAYTLGTDFRRAWRRPVSEVLDWNRFD